MSATAPPLPPPAIALIEVRKTPSQKAGLG
jgi:hypothetical protein